MAFATYSVGPYTSTYNSVDLGTVEGVWMVEQTGHAQDVRSGLYGDSVIDGVYRGGDCFAVCIVKEWVASTKSAIWPFGAQGVSGIIGRLMSDMALELKLTAVTGTPAATSGPVTRTFALAAFAPAHTIRVPLGAEERNIPITFRCYPSNVTPGSSQLRWFTDT